MNRYISPVGRAGTVCCWYESPLFLAMLCVLGAAAGCSTHEAASRDVTRAIEEWERPRHRIDRASATTRPASGSTQASGTSSGPNREGEPVAHAPSDLQRYIAIALEQNPTIRAAQADAQAKLARIPQVTSLSDPMLKTIVRPEPIQTAAGDAYLTLGVGQKIPLPAKLEQAGKVAAAEVRMAIEQLNAARLQVIADVERAWYRLYLADRSLEITRANRQLLSDLEKVLSSQYRVGRIQQQDVLRVQTELSNLLNDEDRLERQRLTAAAALNQLMNRAPSTEVAKTEPMRPTDLGIEVDRLIELAREHNPELARLTQQAERDRESIALADLGYWPDLDVGFEWTHLRGRDAWVPPTNPRTGMRPPVNRKSEAGDDNWALTFQVNIPLWTERIEAARREARLKLIRTQHEHQAAVNLVSFRIYDAWARAETGRDTVALLESTILPQARQTFEVSLTAYQAGTADLLTVIDNWQRMLTFELMLHREVSGLESALAELQREIGVELIRGKLSSSKRDKESDS